MSPSRSQEEGEACLNILVSEIKDTNEAIHQNKTIYCLQTKQEKKEKKMGAGEVRESGEREQGR